MGIITDRTWEKKMPNYRVEKVDQDAPFRFWNGYTWVLDEREARILNEQERLDSQLPKGGCWVLLDQPEPEKVKCEKCAATNVLLVTIGGRGDIPEIVPFEALDGLECVKRRIAALISQLPLIKEDSTIVEVIGHLGNVLNRGPFSDPEIQKAWNEGYPIRKAAGTVTAVVVDFAG